MALRSNISTSLQVVEELKRNVLPRNLDVVAHWSYLRKQLSDTDPQYFKKIPGFTDVKQNLTNDVTEIWNNAKLPILSKQRVKAMLKNLLDKFTAAQKRAKTRKQTEASENWLLDLFDIRKCKCSVKNFPEIRNKKML